MKLTGRRNQCASCSKFFNSSTAFDMHRTGEHEGNHRRCMTMDEMLAHGMATNSAGFWVTELMPKIVLEKKWAEET